MGPFEKLFREQPFFPRLRHRAETFAKIIKHLDDSRYGSIIETGTLRITDNFEGDGQSTFLWNWFCSLENNISNWTALSVDIDPKAVAIAALNCPNVQVTEMDSLKFLSTLPSDTLDDCRLLYLDSFDWSPEIHLDSCFHHMAELACVYAKLPSGCLIVVDDKHGPLAGKHMMLQFFFEKLNVTPLFDAYQMGWIKP